MLRRRGVGYSPAALAPRRACPRARAGRWVGDVVAPLVGGEIAFGPGRCFGTWPLEPGDRFVARVSAVDFALNESAPTPVTLAARGGRPAAAHGPPARAGRAAQAASDMRNTLTVRSGTSAW